MLRKATEADIQSNMDSAYQLTLDPSRSGYHIYTDGIKTKQDFEETMWQGLRMPTRELLVFEKNGTISGWIQFFLIPEDKYLQTVLFSIEEDTAMALEEFTAYCTEKHPGFTLYLGFPGENQTALSYLEAHGWQCDERCWNDVVHLEQYHPQTDDENIIGVTQENYNEFRMLHDNADTEMYWNSDRIYQALDRWHIYVYYRDAKPVGAIYFQSDSNLSEIFGIDFANGIFDSDIYRNMLKKAMNVCKELGSRHLCYFNNTESQAEALKAGFFSVGEYILYIKTV